MDALNIFVVIVTYNRKALLMRCLSSIVNQSHKPDRILIVDNASTDGTHELLQSIEWLVHESVEILTLPDNTGGAGGFAAGLKHATETGADWVWMMDDDADPHSDALEKLLLGELNTSNIYGSVAVNGEKLAWPMLPPGEKHENAIYRVDQLPASVEVQFIPFLGIFISKEVVESIGLPDVGFFLAADDVEYCMRAKKHGAQVILFGGSRIEHPASERYKFWLPGRPFYSLKLPPWKRYYDVRNRIFIARKYYGSALWYKTIPGSFLRLFATLWHEGNRLQQIKAFTAGMIDGLLGKKGKRHEIWGIKF